MIDHKAKAKQLLVHYFELVASAAGVRLDGDCFTEIGGIVDHIVAAAVQEVADSIVSLDLDA